MPRKRKCPECRTRFVEFTRYDEEKLVGVTRVSIEWRCDCGASGSEYAERGAPNPIVRDDGVV